MNSLRFTEPWSSRKCYTQNKDSNEPPRELLNNFWWILGRWTHSLDQGKLEHNSEWIVSRAINSLRYGTQKLNPYMNWGHMLHQIWTRGLKKVLHSFYCMTIFGTLPASAQMHGTLHTAVWPNFLCRERKGSNHVRRGWTFQSRKRWTIISTVKATHIIYHSLQ